MKVRLLPLLLALVLAMPATAKDKERTFSASPEKVFSAAVEVLKANNEYTLLSVEHEERQINFRTSGGMRAMRGYDVVASVVGRPEGCSGEACRTALVRIRVFKRHGVITWGGGGAVASKFFERLEERLKN